MSEKTVIITEKDGKYQMENNGITEFALIGILECALFDLKTAAEREDSPTHQKGVVQEPKWEPVAETIKEVDRETTGKPVKATPQEQSAPDLRTRISNAVKAIKGLGGQAGESDRSDATDEELQTELEELTNQYKRLKNSKGAGK